MSTHRMGASRAATSLMILGLAACGGGSGSGSRPPPTYTVGGTVSGLTGSGLVLRDNGADDLPVSANGAFTFPTPIVNGAAYAASVEAQPTNPPQNCFVTDASGSGTVSTANATSVTVKCANVGRFLYVVNYDSDSVSAFTIDAVTGALAAIAGSPYSAGRYPVSVAVTPDGRFAYVASSDGVSAYTIDRATGALTANVSGTIPQLLVGDRPNSIAVDPTGTFVYLLNPGSIGVYRIDANSGALAAVPGSPFGAGNQPVSIAFDRDLRFAYVADYGLPPEGLPSFGDIEAYRIDAKTGALTKTGTFAPCANPPSPAGFTGGPSVYSVVVDLSGQFAVAFVEGDTNGPVWKFPIDSATGAITSATCPDAGLYNPLKLDPGGKVDLSLWLTHNATDGGYGGGTLPALDPSGRFGFAFCPAGLCAFSIDANTGIVAPAAASALQPSLLRRFVALHPSGKFAYTLDDPDGISVYSVDATTGALVAAPAIPVAVGTKPEVLAISADGRFAYTANWGSKDISGYAIDAGSGSLTPLPGSPFAFDLDPASVVADPLGRFLYAVDSNIEAIEAFPTNAMTGVLTTGAGPTSSSLWYVLSSMAVEPLGRFAYSTGTSRGAINQGVDGYSIAATTGMLAPLAGNPFPLGATPLINAYPTAVIVDPQGRFVLTANNDPEVAADGVSVSAIDPVTGALALVPGSPFAAGLQAISIAVDPTGKFVYVLNSENYPGSGISAFSIDSMTGALTPVAGATATAGANPINITVDPRGAFVYVACTDGVWAFAIDGATGALSPVAGNLFAPGVSNPVAFAVTN